MFPAVAISETITIVADDWCPYNCEPNSALPGYVVEIVGEIFGKAGYNLEYRSVPWARALKEVLAGTYEGAIAATSKELPDGIFPQEELGYYSNYFIIRKGDAWRFISMESLKSVRLGAIKNYNYGKALNSFIEKNKDSMAVQVLAGNNAVERNLKKLLQNKIDVYLEDRQVAHHMAKKMGILDKIDFGGIQGRPIALYVGFSPANPESNKYARILSEGIVEMRKSGRLAEILGKYGLGDWK
jgi:polar amino acid transport system substrate-binding protein